MSILQSCPPLFVRGVLVWLWTLRHRLRTELFTWLRFDVVIIFFFSCSFPFQGHRFLGDREHTRWKTHCSRCEQQWCCSLVGTFSCRSAVLVEPVRLRGERTSWLVVECAQAWCNDSGHWGALSACFFTLVLFFPVCVQFLDASGPYRVVPSLDGTLYQWKGDQLRVSAHAYASVNRRQTRAQRKRWHIHASSHAHFALSRALCARGSSDQGRSVLF